LDDSVGIATYRNHRDNPVTQALRHNVTSTARTRAECPGEASPGFSSAGKYFP
jgi:hypothetical protein